MSILSHIVYSWATKDYFIAYDIFLGYGVYFVAHNIYFGLRETILSHISYILGLRGTILKEYTMC